MSTDDRDAGRRRLLTDLLIDALADNKRLRAERTRLRMQLLDAGDQRNEARNERDEALERLHARDKS